MKAISSGETGTGDGPLTAPADARRLRQVLTNLVENALRHTSAGGTITVRARRDGPDAVLEVADTGSGIAPEHLPHIFDRFYRASEARAMPGSGLGLSIVRRVVQAHGGTVSAQNAEGGGSVFRLRLPALPFSPPPEPKAVPETGPGKPRSPA